jgi:transposase
MSIERKTVVRYSLSFKQGVIREMEEQGLTQKQISSRYGIKGSRTVFQWIRKFGKNNLLNKTIRIQTMEEKDRIKYLEDEVKKLKLALADSLLAQRSLEVVIDEANKEYKTDLKKSFGDAVLPGSGKNFV